jgi:glycine dehydrogenase subunit 1
VNPHAPDQPFFKEFVVQLPAPVEHVNRVLLEEHGILGGYDLGQDYAHLGQHMLVAVTEMNTRADIDRLVDALEVLRPGANG